MDVCQHLTRDVADRGERATPSQSTATQRFQGGRARGFPLILQEPRVSLSAVGSRLASRLSTHCPGEVAG